MIIILFVLGIAIIVMSLLLLLVTPFGILFAALGIISIIASRRMKKQAEIDAAKQAEHREYVRNHYESYDIAGLYYHKENVEQLLDDDGDYIGPCLLVPDPENEHDKNAIQIIIDEMLVGFIPATECVNVKKRLNDLINAEAAIRSDENDGSLDGTVSLEFR